MVFAVRVGNLQLLKPLPCFQANLSLRSYQFAAHHPQVRQRKQLGHIFFSPRYRTLANPNWRFDHAKRMLDLGAHTGFELFGLLDHNGRPFAGSIQLYVVAAFETWVIVIIPSPSVQ